MEDLKGERNDAIVGGLSELLFTEGMKFICEQPALCIQVDGDSTKITEL